MEILRFNAPVGSQLLRRGLLIAAALIGLPLLSACSSTQSPAVTAGAPTTVAEQAQPRTEYERLLAEARQLSFSLDFDALRRAYVESPQYNPYGGTRIKGLPEAFQAVERGDFDACLEHLDGVLATNFMSLEAHMIGVVCGGGGGNYEREDLHRFMVDGLMAAIEGSGDGRSEDSAYRTISVSESQGYVRLKGLQVLEQSIVYGRDGVFDKLRVRDPENGEEYALYFNVSDQFAHSMGSSSDAEPAEAASP